MSKADRDWWRQAVVYQIYPRSFADANGDGIGDFKGITSRVAYLEALGVDAVWLSPFYPSALKDGGYDVSDYRNVDPRIGTLDEFDKLVEALHGVGIKMMVDIVPNHSSDDHEWFQEALNSPKGSAARERFFFRDGVGPAKDLPPTDWQSTFGGSAWSPSGANDGQFYFHMFDSSQPDLNWDHPDIRADFIKTLRFWADRGVSGFRIDVAHGLAKDFTEPLPNWEELSRLTTEKLRIGNAGLKHPLIDRDEVHEIYRDWRKVFNEYDPPLIAVAECWVASDRKHLYASSDGLGQAFSFDILLCNFNADEYRSCIKHSLDAAKKGGESMTWVLSNHDGPWVKPSSSTTDTAQIIRHATRFGLPPLLNTENHKEFMAGVNAWLVDRFQNPKVDLDTGLRKARAATLMILALPGSTYIYQGEELGLPEIIDIPDSSRQDPSFHRTKGAEVGRDGCRVPLPWSNDAKHNFGFGSGQPAHLPQPDWMGRYAVDAEEADGTSTLSMYRRANHLRKKLQCEETLEWVGRNAKGHLLHFRRPGGWEVILNTGETAVNMPPGEVLINSTMEKLHGELPGYTAVWLQV